MENTELGPKEIATALGVSERSACRLMASGAIESMRAGVKLWRTTRAHLAAYQRRQFELAQQSPRMRELMQSIACFREMERLDLITPEQSARLLELEAQLAERQARRPSVA